MRKHIPFGEHACCNIVKPPDYSYTDMNLAVEKFGKRFPLIKDKLEELHYCFRIESLSNTADNFIVIEFRNKKDGRKYIPFTVHYNELKEPFSSHPNTTNKY